MESPKKAPDQRGLYLATFRNIDRVKEFFPSLQFLNITTPPNFPTGVSYLQSNSTDQVVCVWEIREAKGEFEGVFLELAHWSAIQNWYVTLPYLCNSDAHVQTNFKFLAELFRRFAGKQWTVFIRDGDWATLKNGIQELKTKSRIDFQVRVPSNVPGQSKRMTFVVFKKNANPEIPRQPEVALNSDPMNPMSAPPLSESMPPFYPKDSRTQDTNISHVFQPPHIEEHKDAAPENTSFRSLPPYRVEEQRGENPVAAQASNPMVAPEPGVYVPDLPHPAEEYKEVLPSVDPERSSAVPPTVEAPSVLDIQRQDYIVKQNQKFEERKQEAMRANPIPPFVHVPIPMPFDDIPQEPAQMSSMSLRRPAPSSYMQNQGQRDIPGVGILAGSVMPRMPPGQAPFIHPQVLNPYFSSVPISGSPRSNPPQQIVNSSSSFLERNPRQDFAQFSQTLPVRDPSRAPLPDYPNPNPEERNLVKCPEEDFRCLICLSIFKDPLVTACCGSIICKVCAPRIRRCPVCRINTDLVPNKTLSRILSGMTERCACGMEIQARSYEQHMFKCPNKKFSCPECNREWAKQEFLQHLKKKHKNQILAALARIPLLENKSS